MAVPARLIASLAAGHRDPTTGLALAGGSAAFFDRDTGDPVTVYQDPDREDTHPHPVVLDGGGAEDCYVDQDVMIRLYNSAGELVHTIESVSQAVTTREVALEQTDDSSGEIFSATELETVLRLWLTSANGTDWKYKRSAGTGVVARYIKAKLGQLVDVRDFGATGDGTTDDVATFTNALAQVPSTGGMLLVPAGNYKFSSTLTVTDKLGLSIVGEGAGSIITANADGMTLITVTATSAGTTKNLLIADLQLRGNGDGSATNSVGISLAANVRQATLERLRFTGPDATHGFTTAIVAALTTATIRQVHIEQIRNTGVGINITSGVGITCQDVTIAGGTTTGIGIGCVTTVGGSGHKILDCTINGCASGVVLLCDTTLVRGCLISTCTSTGVTISAATARCRVIANDFLTCGVGVQVTTTAVAGPPVGFVIAENTISGSTTQGIQLTTSLASYAPTKGVIANNTIRNSGREAIWAASDDCVFSGNVCADNSNTTIRTYAAIKITTVKIGGTNYGGSRNVLVGNLVRETPGTYEHLCALDVTDEDGTYLNVYTTVVLENYFPQQATNGTLCGIRFAGTANITGNATVGLQTASNAKGDGRDARATNIDGTASVTLTALDSGRHYLCDDTAGNCAFTLPTLAAGTGDFVRYRITRMVAGGNTISVARGGTNTITHYGTSGATSISLTATQGASIDLIFLGGVWYVFDTNPVAASDSIA